MANPTFSPAIAREFFASLEQIHLVYIHPNGVGIHARDFGTDVDAAIEGAEKANAQGFNIYWTVNIVRPGLNRKPGKADITHARFVHVDIDPPKSGGAFDKGAIIAGLLDIDIPPSLIIDSGGGLQAFWRLDGPCANLASIEAINTQARDWFDADACQNIDRLMRVPGSVNWPDKKKIARGRTPRLATIASPDDGTVHEPEALAASFPPAKPTSANPAQAAVNIPADIAPVTPDDLGLSSLDPLRLAIETPPGLDRSGDGLAVARLMANSGYADAQIMGVLLNPANTVSGHFLDQRDPRRAAARAIQLVRQDGPPEGETLHAPLMSDDDFAVFVANMRAKVRRGMSISARIEAPEDDGGDEVAPRYLRYEPEWLTALGDGGIAKFVRHVVATAPSPQPWVALGAALSMFGSVAGRRYAGPTDLRTNIYSIGICDSGGGKDHPLRAITRLLTAAGCHQRIGGSKIASGQAMITDITKHLNMIYPLDEVGFLISSAADRKRAPKHITDIIDNLTEFYSMASHTFLGTSYADQSEQGGKPRQVIEQPCLCLFGVTTPGVFWGSLSSGNVLDGSLARMLIFQSEMNYPDANHDAVRAPMPDDLIALVQAIDAGAEGHNPFPMGEAPSITPKPYTVPYADENAAIFAREMRNRQITMLREHEGTNLTGIIARLAENAAKIALIKAITDNPARPSITAADLEWGMKVASISVTTLKDAVTERVADNDYEACVKLVHLKIKNAGSAGIDGNGLSRATQKIDRRKRQDILAHLEEAGMIRVAKFKKNENSPGPEKRIYYDIS